jgi:hypothetical protein
MKTAGYSGTPLATKLGIAEGTRVVTLHAPDEYRSWLEPIPGDVRFGSEVSASTDVVHVFADRKARLESVLHRLRRSIRSDAAVWVSWPKKSSKIVTDITEDVIRDLALPLGFVDVKVCAVSDVWSGLKLMIRRELR